jgi:hypothetical protein
VLPPRPQPLPPLLPPPLLPPPLLPPPLLPPPLLPPPPLLLPLLLLPPRLPPRITHHTSLCLRQVLPHALQVKALPRCVRLLDAPAVAGCACVQQDPTSNTRYIHMLMLSVRLCSTSV